MASNNQPSPSRATWTSAQAYTFAVITLLLGLVAGWFVRGSQSPSASSQVANNASAPANMGMGQQQMPSPEQMKHMADTQAAPMIAELKSKPNDPTLLAKIGNIYYDTQQYKDAIDYYQRALNTETANTNVRTDLATAYW